MLNKPKSRVFRLLMEFEEEIFELAKNREDFKEALNEFEPIGRFMMGAPIFALKDMFDVYVQHFGHTSLSDSMLELMEWHQVVDGIRTERGWLGHQAEEYLMKVWDGSKMDPQFPSAEVRRFSNECLEYPEDDLNDAQCQICGADSHGSEMCDKCHEILMHGSTSYGTESEMFTCKNCGYTFLLTADNCISFDILKCEAHRCTECGFVNVVSKHKGKK